MATEIETKPTEVQREPDVIDSLISISRELCLTVRDSLSEFKTLRRAFIALIGLTVVACCVLSVLIVQVQGNIARRETVAILDNQEKIYGAIQDVHETCRPMTQSESPR